MSNELAELTMKTLALMKDATTQGLQVSTGLQHYDLESQAKRLYPVLTPLRNQTPRAKKTSGYGTAAHWKIISAINSGSPEVFVGVSEGNRNAVMSTTEADKIATYKGIGLENSVTFEGDYAAEGFDDLRALAQITNLEALMLGEERMIFWGNTGFALGTTPTPTVVGSGSGGSWGAGTAYVYCVALTPLGMRFATGGSLTPVPATVAALSAAVVSSFTRPNADGSSDTISGGAAIQSAVGSGATSSGNTVAANVTPVKGAAYYAWFAGSTAGQANAKLAAITSGPSVVLPGPGNAGNQAANYTGFGTDFSANALSFDGFIYQLLESLTTSQPGYFSSLAGAALTSDGHGNCNEIMAAFKYFWDTFRIWPDDIWVGSRIQKELTAITLSGTTNPVYNVIMQNSMTAQGEITAGALVTKILNPFGLNGAIPCNVRLHPDAPDGWIFFDTTHVPYPNSNIPGIRRIVTRQEYYSREWPVVTRKYQYGTYADEVLQHYAPFALGLLSDVG